MVPGDVPAQAAGRSEDWDRRWTGEALAGGYLYLVVLGVLGIVVAASPLSEHVLSLFTIAIVYTLATTGYSLQIGRLGGLNLAQVGFFGAGAYGFAILTTELGYGTLPAIAWTVIALAVVALLFSIVTEVDHVYQALATLAIPAIFKNFYLAFPQITGGAVGLSDLPRLAYLPAKDNLGHFLFSLAVLMAVSGVWLLWLNRGGMRMLDIVHSNERLAAAVGIDAPAVKRLVFVMSSATGAIAGTLYAKFFAYVSPDQFDIHLIFVFLAIVLVGGCKDLVGPLAGSLLIVFLPELTSVVGNMHILFFGLLLIVFALVMPGGVADAITRLGMRLLPRRWRASRAVEEAMAAIGVAGSDESSGPQRRGRLVLRNLSLSFGKNRVVDHLDLDIAPGAITALVGPNGAGKTSVLNLIGGYLKPDDGSIAFDGADITRFEPHRRTTGGICRTFQIPQLVESWSLPENVAVGPLWHTQAHLSLWIASIAWPVRMAQAYGALQAVGVSRDVQERGDGHGGSVLRLSDVARALTNVHAGKCSLLLLDEPAAGLAPPERDQLMHALKALRDRGVTLLLVEHNLAFVEALADTVVILDRGRVIAKGSFAEVMQEPQVRTAYLGEQGR